MIDQETRKSVEAQIAKSEQHRRNWQEIIRQKKRLLLRSLVLEALEESNAKPLSSEEIEEAVETLMTKLHG